MKAKILKTFTDKEKKELQVALQDGSGVWTGTKERFEAINKAGNYLQAIEEEKPSQKQGAKDSETKELKPKGDTK